MRLRSTWTLGSIVLLPILGSGGCAASTSPQRSPPACCRAAATPGSDGATILPGRMLYTIADAWETDTAQHIHLSDLSGRPQIIAMFYAKCQGKCLITFEHMREIEASLPPAIRDRVGFVLITFDPEHDTAQSLAAYRAERNLPLDRWTLLRGNSRATAALASTLNTQFSLRSARGISHTIEITVVDATGKIVQGQAGTHPDLGRTRQAVIDTLRSEPPPELPQAGSNRSMAGGR